MANLFYPVQGYNPVQPDVLGAASEGYDIGKGFAQDYYARKDKARASELVQNFRTAMTQDEMQGGDTSSPQMKTAEKKPTFTAKRETPSFIQHDDGDKTFAVRKTTTPEIMAQKDGGAAPAKMPGLSSEGITGKPTTKAAMMPGAKTQYKKGEDDDISPDMDIPLKTPTRTEEANSQKTAQMAIERLERYMRSNPQEWQELVQLAGSPQAAMTMLIGGELNLQDTKNRLARTEDEIRKERN